MASSDFPLRVTQKLDEIEAEMHSIGLWQTSPLRADQLDFSSAFGADTMAFSQWLQFIFLPRAREAIAANRFPRSSNVGTQAIREFDTEPNAAHLTNLLNEFDALIEGRP
ncbi:MAG TPA: YqcC family protein [Anaerolineales bacterium]|nr:YqcC family protein [Anaerolineales bacterium]